MFSLFGVVFNVVIHIVISVYSFIWASDVYFYCYCFKDHLLFFLLLVVLLFFFFFFGLLFLIFFQFLTFLFFSIISSQRWFGWQDSENSIVDVQFWWCWLE